MRKSAIVGAVILIVVGGAIVLYLLLSQSPGAAPEQATETARPAPPAALQTSLPAPATSPAVETEIVAENLEIPWELAFLPDGSMLITERPGRLLKIGEDRAVIPIDGVQHIGEGGLLGLALHPNFSSNQFIYLYLTTRTGSGLTNRVERYRLDGTALSDRQVIIENIPGAQFHDGGRIAFGPDSKLYITTGDAGTESNAQNRDSLAGKILRLNDDGTIPSDNPPPADGEPAIYSYGHRNPQGLAWDPAGNLWATEHGRSGILSGFDEVNLIEPGNNYGWPEIQGDNTEAGMQVPKAHSGSSTTWAPSGAAFFGNSLFFAGLRGEAVYEARVSGTSVAAVVPHFQNEFGRLRTVQVGPDGNIYILTNNRDGRGNIQSGDDKIIRVHPSLFQ